MRNQKDFTIPHCLPFLDGVYLVINTVPDLAVVIDSPSCALLKAERVQGNHDFLATLSPLKNNRLYYSSADLSSLSMGVEDKYVASLKEADKNPTISRIVSTAISMAIITDRQYDMIHEEIKDQLQHPITEVPSRELYGDWLDGYKDTLAALAKDLPLDTKDGGDNSNKVGIVGYMMDRNEGDHIGNLEELKRIISALGLELVSVWPCGEPTDKLAQIGQAGTIISLPYGRKAAQIISRRNDAKLIDAPLPLGLDKTKEFVSIIAEACGKQDIAERFIAEEEKQILPKLNWIIPQTFLDKKIAISGDPYTVEGLADVVEFLGAEAMALFCSSRAEHAENEWSKKFGVDRFSSPLL